MSSKVRKVQEINRIPLQGNVTIPTITQVERTIWNDTVTSVETLIMTVADIVPSDTVTTQAFSDTPNAGASSLYSRADHKHGMMAAPATADLTGTIIAMAIALG